MPNAEERMQILHMIEEGKITAAEGAELLRALEQEPPAHPAEPLKGAGPPRWFRVRITDLTTGKNKVSVNIPMGLANVGMKMGARFVPKVEGLNFDELSELIQASVQGKVIDVVDNDERERVEIFVE
ncbi:MAG: SHOCT-like domain-containing protein [Candidatus Promineifilaceae bacterium]